MCNQGTRRITTKSGNITREIWEKHYHLDESMRHIFFEREETEWNYGMYSNFYGSQGNICKILPQLRTQQQKQSHFQKSSKGGGGSILIKQFFLQILGTFNRAFWAWNWYKGVTSGFRVCFFQQLYWEKSKQNTLWRRF